MPNSKTLLARLTSVRCSAVASIFLAASAGIASAQVPDRFVVSVEAENEAGEQTLFVGTPTGSDSVVLIAPAGVKTIGDADNIVTLFGLGGPVTDVTVEEEFDYVVSADGTRAQLILLDLSFPDGRTLSPSQQADEALADDTDVTAFTFRAARDDQSQPTRMTFRQRVATGADGTFSLRGMTESAPAASVSLGGFVFDTCGNLTAIAPASEDGPALIAIDPVSNLLKANSAAEALELAEPCKQSSGASKAVARAEAAVEEAQRRSEEAAEREAEAKKQREAAEAELQALKDRNASAEAIAAADEKLTAIIADQDERSAEVTAIQKQIDESNALLAEAQRIVEEDGGELAGARQRIKIGTYLLAICGAIAVIALGFIIWFIVRSRRMRSDLAAVKDEKRDIEEAKAAAESKWNDCILENDQGFTVKLPGSKIPKAKGGVTVGRSREDADVVIDREDVSRRHARFEAEGDTVELTDLGSTNKTLVNGSALERGIPRRLYEGDKITFGTNEFKFKIVGL